MTWHAWEEEPIEILPDVIRTNTKHQRRVRIKQPFLFKDAEPHLQPPFIVKKSLPLRSHFILSPCAKLVAISFLFLDCRWSLKSLP
jgi:hypothetical protein